MRVFENLRRRFKAWRARHAARALAEWSVERQTRCTVYRGAYCVVDRAGKVALSLPGQIVEWPGLPTDVYVSNVPPAVMRHEHGRCLQLVSPNGPWFKLHWERPAWDFGASRAYVEGLLAEACL